MGHGRRDRGLPGELHQLPWSKDRTGWDCSGLRPEPRYGEAGTCSAVATMSSASHLFSEVPQLVWFPVPGGLTLAGQALRFHCAL